MEDKVMEVLDLGNDAFSSVAPPPVKTKEIVVTVEEQMEVFSGKRPEGMDYDVYRKVRKDLDRATKLYKGGKYKHLSTWVEDIVNEDGNKVPVKKSKTFIKER